MIDYDDVKNAIDEIGDAFAAFKGENRTLIQQTVGEAIREEREHREALERKINAQRFNAPADPASEPTAYVYDRESKRRVPLLSHKHRLSDLPEYRSADPLPSMGRVLRGLVLGSRADDARELAEERKSLGIVSDASGGILAPDVLSARWVDLLRSRMVLSAAGAVSIPMDSKSLTLAVVNTDPAVAWHAENASLTASDPTFGSLALSAKTIATVVKISLELAQDAANIEQVLERTLVGATAAAIDSAGLVGSATSAGLAPGGLFNVTGRNTVTSVGAPVSWDWLTDGMYELLLDNVPAEDIGALVAHPAVWRKMRKLKTGLTNDNTPLLAPAEVAALPKLWTTSAPFTGGNTAKAIIGNWSDCIIGMRKDISVRLLSEAFMGSNLQVALVCYARVDVAAARPQSFCTMEGITVA